MKLSDVYKQGFCRNTLQRSSLMPYYTGNNNRLRVKKRRFWESEIPPRQNGQMG